MMKKWKRMWGLVMAVMLLCMNLAGAQEIPKLLEPVGVQMDTAVASLGDIRQIEIMEGVVRPRTEELYFTIPGKVGQVHAVVGQEVKKGDKLISYDQESQEKKLLNMQETLLRLETQAAMDEEMARLEMEILLSQLHQLRHQGAEKKQIDLKELDIEEEKLNQGLEKALRDREIEKYRQNVAKLEEEMKAGVLYAPCDGRIFFSQSLVPGSSVKAYQPILYLADETELTIESDFISGAVLQHAFSVYALIEDKRLEIEPVEIDMKEYVSLVLAGEEVMSQFRFVTSASDIRAGQFAMVCVVTKEAENTLVIPTNCLYSDANGKYVYLIEDGKRVRRDVKTGISTEWDTQITQGLEEGAVVYVKE